jgi:hypothetical protein
MHRITQFISRTHIAYFSMEIALRSEMHTYAGGLGVLAGDTVRSCADLNLPLVFVTLISRKRRLIAPYVLLLSKSKSLGTRAHFGTTRLRLTICRSPPASGLFVSVSQCKGASASSGALSSYDA